MTHADHDERRDDDCPECRAEFDAAYSEHRVTYRAEREMRQSLKLVAEDLDMGRLSELDARDVAAAIQRHFKQ